jgi:hypothetical protein
MAAAIAGAMQPSREFQESFVFSTVNVGISLWDWH